MSNEEQGGKIEMGLPFIVFQHKHPNKDLKLTKKKLPHLDTSRGVFGLPRENNNESWQKTDGYFDTWVIDDQIGKVA